MGAIDAQAPSALQVFQSETRLASLALTETTPSISLSLSVKTTLTLASFWPVILDMDSRTETASAGCSGTPRAALAAETWHFLSYVFRRGGA